MSKRLVWFWFKTVLLSIIYGWILYKASSIAVWWFCTMMFLTVVIVFLQGLEYGRLNKK